MPSTSSWSDLTFIDRFVSSLPGDVSGRPGSRQVHEAHYARVDPTPTQSPTLLIFAAETAALLNLTEAMADKASAARVLSGNALVGSMAPYAMVYGGHQFGHWAGQLGDGRAIALGERRGTDGQLYTLQLKGAGPTPFSRGSDGRAVLRSSVREFLMSEAMFHLGVPTTRALSLTLTGDAVVRDMFYSGNPQPERGAVVCRVAQSFLRFGNFQIFADRGDKGLLRQLATYAWQTHFAPAARSADTPTPKDLAAMLAEVARRTAVMVAHWMRVGFVHGVMNTDNMSLLGQTIDYGPYGWVDNWDLDWTPNTTDFRNRRYRFGQQAQVAEWNLRRFAEALYPLVLDEAALTAAVEVFGETYAAERAASWTAKLGLTTWRGDADDVLVQSLQDVFREVEVDMTIFFRRLADVDVTANASSTWLAPIRPAFYWPLEGDEERLVMKWLRRYVHRIRDAGVSNEKRRAEMNAANPKYVLRNYLAQLAIDDADRGDSALLHTLHEVLRHPYDEQPQYERFFVRRPEWARHKPGCSTLSCSS